MNKTILTAAALLAAGAPVLHAQQDLTKQVEVTRAYTPRIGNAAKIAVVPDMTDTVRLRPQLEYGITSRASATSFATRAFEAASVVEERAEATRQLYMRAGAVAPTGSLFDIYYKPRMAEGRAFGLFANHRGSFSRIENDLGGRKPTATETSDGAGLWFTRKWERRRVEVDATYDRRMLDPYGVALLPPSISSVPAIQSFVYDRGADRIVLGLGRLGVRFGDTFSDLGRFNFSVGADGGYAHSRDGSGEARFDAHVKMAKTFGDGTNGFELTLSERGAFGDGAGGRMAGESSVVVAVEPRYLLRVGHLNVRAGLDVRHMKNAAHFQNRVGVAPSVELRYDTPGGGFVPFVSLTSRTEGGDHEALSRRNPYVDGSGATEWITDARVGFEGDVGGVFHYRVSGGASMFRDHSLMVGVQSYTRKSGTDSFDLTVEHIEYDPLTFAPMSVDGSRYTARAELGVHDLGGFGARVWGEWNKFDFREEADASFVPVADLPSYEAGTELSYRRGDRFSVRLGARFIGERDYLVLWTHPFVLYDSNTVHPAYTQGTIAPAVDVTLAADVKVTGGVWAFLEGSNLAGQRLYPYPHYRGLGANVALGVKLVF